MYQEPLVEQKEMGRAFLAEFEKLHHVKAAFWVLEFESDRWTLCIASDDIDDSRIKDGYGDVRRATEQMQGPKPSLFQVKLLKPDDPAVLEVIDILSHHSRSVPIEYRAPRLGRLSIEAAYLYPMPVAAA